MAPKSLFALALALCAAALCAPAARAQSECAPPPIVANAKTSNIFTPEQEMVFGELVVENMADELRFVRDERLLAYVDAIGQRLAKHLPPTGLAFRFHLVDLPEANAFNIPGGHVFVSRKLVGFASSEDELAGVIAHELGHAAVRHAAADVSETLKKLLNVTSLGDRKDVTEKYNLLIERARTKRVSRGGGHENDQQQEADRLGLFAMVAAGYDPTAFTSFFDRLTESEGKTGGWLSDLFGKTRPEQKRMREMIKATGQLPAACREGRKATASEDFLKWQADTVSFREAGREERLPGLLWKKELQPKLRSDVSHFAFSPDGRYLLAQDDFSVTVVEREPLRVLFQIPVEGAQEAAFTPDGQSVVFTTENLRYERWSVAERKPVEVRELVVRQDCWEHRLSPDGRYLACIDTSTAINVLDTKTGKRVWEKKNFYQLDFFEYIIWLALGSRAEDDDHAAKFFRVEFSPDSRYVMFSRSDMFRSSLTIDGLKVLGTENAVVALDLTTMKQADLGGDVKKLAARPYLFLDSERVLGMPATKSEEAGVFSFPAGKRLQKFVFNARLIKRTANPDLVVVKPLMGAAMGIYDIKRGAVVNALNREDATMWGNLQAVESTDGKVRLREMSFNDAEKRTDMKEVAQIELPVGAIGGLDAAEVSDGFGWLLLSSKTRGGLWNLGSGERKLYVRGFKGAAIGDDGAAVGDFPRFGEVPHSLVLLNPSKESVTPVRELPERGARQYGRFVLLRRGLKEKEGGGDAAALAALLGGESSRVSLSREVRFELKDFIKDKVIWSRDFPKEAPEYSFDDYTGRLIFYWRLGSDAGKARLKETPELQPKAAALGNKSDDYLVEVVDAFAGGKTVGTLLLETGKGSFDVGEGQSEGDWLVLHDSEGRVLVYSIKGGDLRHRFFGGTSAINPRRNQLAVENFRGEVTLYDLDTGDRQADIRVNGDAAFLRYNLVGDKLFVLSDAQTAYAFDLNKLGARAAQASAPAQ